MCARAVFEACGAKVQEFDDIKAKHKPTAGLPVVHEIVFNDLLRNADAVCVVLAPEEEAVLAKHLRKNTEDGQKCMRPRPNVLYEAGLAVRAMPGRVLPLRFVPVDIPSDLLGVYAQIWKSPVAVYDYVHEWLSGLSDHLELKKKDPSKVSSLTYDSGVFLTDEEQLGRLERYVREFDETSHGAIYGALARAGAAYRERLADRRAKGQSTSVAGSDLYCSELAAMYRNRATKVVEAAEAVGLDLERHHFAIIQHITKPVYQEFAALAASDLYKILASVEDPGIGVEAGCVQSMRNCDASTMNSLLPIWQTKLKEIVREGRVGLRPS
jgi:hypothetical protein